MPSNQEIPQGEDKTFTAWPGRQRDGAGSHWDFAYRVDLELDPQAVQ